MKIRWLVVATALVVPASASAELPKLSQADAEFYSAKALQREFGNLYRNAYAKTIKCHDRKSPTRIRCEKVNWVIGDLAYFGWTRIWYSLSDSGRNVIWNYAFKIKRFDEYCAAVQMGDDCTKTYIVR